MAEESVAGVERWVAVAKGPTQEAAQAQFERWLLERKIPSVPTNQIRKHHGLGEDGEYWDVWVLFDDRPDCPRH